MPKVVSVVMLGMEQRALDISRGCAIPLSDTPSPVYYRHVTAHRTCSGRHDRSPASVLNNGLGQVCQHLPIGGFQKPWVPQNPHGQHIVSETETEATFSFTRAMSP